MIKKLDSENMGKSDLGWLNSTFHFSFAEYFNIDNMNFGALRVINDDLIAGNTGFPPHPHKDMEIISYVVNGGLSHADSMGNEKTVYRGQVQYMSAGTGVTHSENNNEDETLRILQIWVMPNKKGYVPSYGDYNYKWEDRINKWLNIVSSKEGDSQVKINQDANFYVTELEEGKELKFKVGAGRQAYLVQIEGQSEINGISLRDKDGMEVVEEDITIKSKTKSHILVIELSKSIRF